MYSIHARHSSRLVFLPSLPVGHVRTVSHSYVTCHVSTCLVLRRQQSFAYQCARQCVNADIDCHPSSRRQLMLYTLVSLPLATCPSIVTAAEHVGTVVTVGQGGQYPTICAAITAAQPGSVIRVSAGTYKEQLTVDRDVTIEATPKVCIKTGTLQWRSLTKHYTSIDILYIPSIICLSYCPSIYIGHLFSVTEATQQNVTAHC